MNIFPAEIANAIVFANSNAGSYSNGQVSYIVMLVLFAYASASIVGIVKAVKSLLLGRDKNIIKEN